ncbi:hypothetical protein Trydic_g10231 [Trypoxylus dichotomus]
MVIYPRRRRAFRVAETRTAVMGSNFDRCDMQSKIVEFERTAVSWDEIRWKWEVLYLVMELGIFAVESLSNLSRSEIELHEVCGFGNMFFGNSTFTR